MIKGAIFDLDGVLIDSSALHLASWKQVGAEMGFTMTDEIFWETFGMPNRQILPLLYERPLSAEEIQALSEQKEEAYRALAPGSVAPQPGAVALLHSQKDECFRVALRTSTPRSNLRVILPALGIEWAFDAVVCGDDVTHGKPDPEVFRTAGERIGVPSERCVVVEDAVVGVQAARGAGMRCLAVTTTHPREKLAEADRVVISLEEVDARDFEALIRAH